MSPQAQTIYTLPAAQLLVGKTAIITGGATGIGRAICLEYLLHGCNVAINYYDPTPGATQTHEIVTLKDEISRLPYSPSSSHRPRFLAIEGDITDPSTSTALIAQTLAEFGPSTTLDIFISNAGICQFHDFLTLPPALLTSTIATNLTGAFYAVQAAARVMVEQGKGGSIIGISSVSALVGGGGQTHYTPTKAGVLSLMQSCAVALGGYGIRCNALLPGTVRTRLNERDLEEGVVDGVGAKGEYMRKRIPLGRVGVPRDVAGPAVFLGSDLSSYVTGAQLLVDGGLFVNLQ